MSHLQTEQKSTVLYHFFVTQNINQLEKDNFLFYFMLGHLLIYPFWRNTFFLLMKFMNTQTQKTVSVIKIIYFSII